MEGNAGKGLTASIQYGSSTETAGGHLGMPRLAGQLMGELTCVSAKQFGYLLKGHKWQMGSLLVVFINGHVFLGQ